LQEKQRLIVTICKLKMVILNSFKQGVWEKVEFRR